MKRNFSPISTYILLAVLFYMGACTAPSTTESTATEGADTTATTTTGTGTTIDSADATTGETSAAPAMSFTPEAIAKLKARFTFDEKTGYYYHNLWKKAWPKRRTLFADVNKTGYYYLSSVYHGDRNLKHSSITATIGETKIASAKVDVTQEKEHRSMKDGAKFHEANYYTNYRDNKIFETIAKNPTEKVKLRFDGKDAFIEAELPEEDKQALIDCYQLSLVLRNEAAAGGAQ